MTRPDPADADALLRDLEPYMRAGPGGPPVPPDLAERVDRFAAASGVDPDNVPALHTHRNPVTGQMVTASWPCPQCTALGRTEPLMHGRDLPDEASVRLIEIPPERLEAYLATFSPLEENPSPAPRARPRNLRDRCPALTRPAPVTAPPCRRIRRGPTAI